MASFHPASVSVAEVLDDLPDLTADDIRACFAFAADRDRRLHVVPHAAALPTRAA